MNRERKYQIGVYSLMIYLGFGLGVIVSMFFINGSTGPLLLTFCILSFAWYAAVLWFLYGTETKD